MSDQSVVRGLLAMKAQVEALSLMIDAALQRASTEFPVIETPPDIGGGIDGRAVFGRARAAQVDGSS